MLADSLSLPTLSPLSASLPLQTPSLSDATSKPLFVLSRFVGAATVQQPWPSLDCIVGASQEHASEQDFDYILVDAP